MKLLRVLQDQTFEVLGDSRPRKVDVRVVSATNADLRTMVSERTFREDLFYRINLLTVNLPSLRERREDIPLLARHFADRQAEVNGLPLSLIHIFSFASCLSVIPLAFMALRLLRLTDILPIILKEM